MEVVISERLNKLFLIGMDKRTNPAERDTAQRLFWQECERHPMHTLKVVSQDIRSAEERFDDIFKSKTRQRRDRSAEDSDRVYRERKQQTARAYRIYEKRRDFMNTATDDQIKTLLREIQQRALRYPHTTPGKKIISLIQRDPSLFVKYTPHGYTVTFDADRRRLYEIEMEIYSFTTDGRINKAYQALMLTKRLWDLLAKTYGVENAG